MLIHLSWLLIKPGDLPAEPLIKLFNIIILVLLILFGYQCLNRQNRASATGK